MNKFEQVSSGGHQMSLAGGPRSDGWSPCLMSGGTGPMSYVQGWGAGAGGAMSDAGLGRALYSKVQWIIGNGHMGTPCEQTETSENITFPQLRWRAVKMGFQNCVENFILHRDCHEHRFPLGSMLIYRSLCLSLSLWVSVSGTMRLSVNNIFIHTDYQPKHGDCQLNCCLLNCLNFHIAVFSKCHGNSVNSRNLTNHCCMNMGQLKDPIYYPRPVGWEASCLLLQKRSPHRILLTADFLSLNSL